jgi:beta-lactamase regulating signal transducer with metallopeptidase domain
VQASAAPAVNNANTVAVNPSSSSAAAPAAKLIVSQEAAVSEWPALQTWAMGGLLVFFTLIALYKRAAARRANSNLESRVRQVKVALS